jgi:aminopeptidase N
MDTATKLVRGAAGAALLACAAVAHAAPFAFDTTPGRLPKHVVPLDYTVEITPDAAALTFTGSETILLDFRTRASELVFDSVNEVLTDVRLDGKPVRSTVSDNDAQLTTVTLPASAPAGRHTLTFAYTGKIEQEARGLFAQDYRKPDGSTARLLSTQFESTDARRMFPCWDEPSFRATFRLRATVPAAWTVVSNMPVASRRVHGGLATTAFERSPKMASYLLEMTAGDIASIGTDAGGTRLNVWAVRGHEQEGAAALDNARQILADYGDYFDYRFPLPKLDLIAIPGGWSGAMENWGAITYNQDFLLETPKSTFGSRQQAFSIQAHEISHQWFGDLVTMAWWDEIWLNESMTFWLESTETAHRHPDWDWWEFKDGEKEAAMRADAQANAEAIHVHVTDELAAADSYNQDLVGGKGQAVMRMFEVYVGRDAFRAGLRSYMHARALSNATSDDLWRALSAAAGRDMAALIGPWAEQPGFPLVSVATRCAPDGARTLILSQQRFLLDGKPGGASHWSVPLQVRAGAAGEPQPVLLDHEGQQVSAGRCGEPLSINADALGYYRVSYDAATLASNSERFATLPDGDRIALLDDQWALVEAGAAPLSSYLALVEQMGAGVNSRAWQQVNAVLDQIERAERGKPGHDAFAAYARRLLTPPFAALGWDAKPDEAPGVQQLRHALIEALGSWGDTAVIAEARRRYAAFRAHPASLAADDQGVVLSVVGQYADATTFEELLALARSATDPSEVSRYWAVPMTVADPALAARAAALAVSDQVPPQATAIRFGMVATVAARHPRLAWQVFSGNAPVVLQALGQYATMVIARDIPELFSQGIPLAEIEAWIRAKVPAEVGPVVDRGLEAARLRLAENAAMVEAADAYLRRP